MSKRKKIAQLIKRMVIFTLVGFVIFVVSITVFNDPVSQRLRGVTENYLNQYIESLTDKALANKLGIFDKTALHASVLAGVTISRFKYPEASALLYHYVYGDGSDLVLSSYYFEQSVYLKNKIDELGIGQHGPIALKQSDDWRLSLALNPYYLNVTNDNITLYHPQVIFAPVVNAKRTMTVVPIGLLKLNVYDNLVSALNTKPFYVYTEWENLN